MLVAAACCCYSCRIRATQIHLGVISLEIEPRTGAARTDASREDHGDAEGVTPTTVGAGLSAGNIQPGLTLPADLYEARADPAGNIQLRRRIQGRTVLMRSVSTQTPLTYTSLRGVVLPKFLACHGEALAGDTIATILPVKRPFSTNDSLTFNLPGA